MSKKDIHLVAILDRSGSMLKLTDDMRNGFNSLKAQQLKEEGDTYITLVTFDNNYERLHTGVNARLVPDLSKSQYFARGGTALFDAIGRTITEVATLKNVPKKTLVVIATDGYENCSIEWRDKTKIKELIDRYQNRAKNPWNFLFMGAGVDSFNSSSYGFMPMTRTMSVTPDSAGIGIYYNTVATAASSLRSGSAMGASTMDYSGVSNYAQPPTTVALDVQPVEPENKPRRRRASKP